MGADYIPVSQVEQGDAADAPPETTTPVQSVEVEDAVAQLNAQIKWSSMWVNYMLAVQVLASFWFPSDLLFIVNLVFNFVGLIGVHRQKRGLISLHFGYTIGLHCVAWFVVFYTMFYATFISILTLAFCLVQSVGLRHERNLLSLLTVVPSTLEQIAVEQDTENTVPEQPVEPQVQIMPAMPSFSYGIYGQQVPSGMEQPMYPGMFPGFYPLPQGYFPYPQPQQASNQQQPPMPMFPGYPFPPQGFAFAPMPVPVPPHPVDIPVSEDNKQ